MLSNLLFNKKIIRDCNSTYASSIPTPASTLKNPVDYRLRVNEMVTPNTL
ncbi:hypothetical protein PVE_R1G2894 [Pseudomonas veronii 1YdBTEX2]|jgi:hypothetical protein|uniref:Uncharacterized protein n=1 Tax=Pseudomonas veronii 1YdBTEX2 TaxID=1295141 RepID=A0A1D3JXF1_PSEVE|nr:hypothetical protein PVE_R1G2894 [Pseudomonas veronii 1YdBTEX2]